MHRREFLGLAGAVVVSGIAQATAVKPTYSVHAFELRVTSKTGETPFIVEEFDRQGKSLGSLRSDDERGLKLFLSRVAREANAPGDVRLVILTGTTLENVWTAVKACRNSGFTRVKYFGCIPPGCGIRSGQFLNQPRYEGKVIALEWLDRVLTENSMKC